MPGWDSLRNLVGEEFAQSVQEGRDADAVNALRKEWEAAGNDEAKLKAVWMEILELPLREDFPFVELSDLKGIRAKRDDVPHSYELGLSDDALYEKMYGAWLARCAGCALGKPVEGFMGERNGLSSKERTKTYLTAIGADEYPLRDYFPQHSPAEEQTGKVGCYPSTREAIAYMESDDDIRYTVIGQLVMQEKGRNFTTRDVAQMWIRQLPYSLVCTAETQAYRNLVMRSHFHIGQDKDEAIDWHWVATHQNPYREWIGAQIRADSWGYAAPGNPELAAEFAWRDARLSHVKNGIYGEMFVAAMIAAAFVMDNPRAIVAAGLAEIPNTSRLYAEMQQTLEICAKYNDDPAEFEAVLEEIYALLGHYHPVHTNNNAALVVAALVLGGQDLDKVITIAVMGGWDTDCNGATAGSIAGAMLGASALPQKWIAPLNDTLNSLLIGYHPIAISECARRSVAIARKVEEGK